MTSGSDLPGVGGPGDGGRDRSPVRRRRRPLLGVLPARAGGTPGGENEWMLTYMDTVTLLLTLFALLLSFSTVSEEKYAAVADDLNLGKYGTGILMGTMNKPPSPSAASTVYSLPGEIAPAAPVPSPGERYESMAAALTRSLSEAGLADAVDVAARKDTVELELNERVLYALGSADLTDRGLSIVDHLAPALSAWPFLISVEGHTDELPISTERFPSNWQLSSARAASVVQRLVLKGVEPTRVRVVGYADTRPIADNLTAVGREQNRRVSIRLTADEGIAQSFAE